MYKDGDDSESCAKTMLANGVEVQVSSDNVEVLLDNEPVAEADLCPASISTIHWQLTSAEMQ